MQSNEYLDYLNKLNEDKDLFFNLNNVYPLYLVLRDKNIDKLSRGMSMMGIPSRANPGGSVYFKGCEIIENSSIDEGFYLYLSVD